MARFYQAKKKPQLETKHQEVRVERMDHQGAGIAYLKNKPVFIDGALPDERVLIQLTENKSRFARAKLIKVLMPSDERTTPFCAHYQACGGCNMQHLPHKLQLHYKQQSLQQLMKKFSGSELLALHPPISSIEKGYRRRTRVSLFWDKKQQGLMFGFRKKLSKQIVNVTDCAVLEPGLNKLLAPLSTLLASLSDVSKLGHLELVQGEKSAVVLLRVTPTLGPQDRARLTEFAQQYQLALYLKSDDNGLELLVGDSPSYNDVGCTIPFLPTNFIQVNRRVNQAMIKQAIDWLDVKPTDHILDLFCGLGNFSLPLAATAKKVVGIEGIQSMVEQASANALANQVENVLFFQANLEQDISDKDWASEHFDKIILDPARAGASYIAEHIAQFRASRIVYVSCNPATLARDSQLLLAQGYRLVKIGMLDMFPHTSHLESMALFEK